MNAVHPGTFHDTDHGSNAQLTATDDHAYDILRETAKVLDLDLAKLKG